MENSITQIADDRFDQEIIAGDPSRYDAIEIHPVRDFLSGQVDQGTCVEVDYVSPNFISTYLHCKQGGVECIGDHPSYALAIAYAQEMFAKYDWPINDFVPKQFHAALPTHELDTAGA